MTAPVQLRIALFSEVYWPMVSGVGVTLLRLTNALEARGHRVRVYSATYPLPPGAADRPEQLASRYAITMTARIELRDTRANAVLWENPSLVFRQEYEATSGTSAVDPAAFFGQDANALDRLGTDFARTIVSTILEAF